MKTLIFAAAMCAPLTAMSEPTNAEFQECIKVMQVFQTAARMRRFDEPPEKALNETRNIDIPESDRKRFINLTYFNRDFIAIPLAAMGDVVLAACMNRNKPQHQPLK